ncbi:putative cytochrome P450 oxidoreductase OrdA-like protein [Hypoxylon rubiginosum]|uniref:Cytochrome P450 oxidoreductase OrdA-like protein n=1 Tax=Hypoxylon rubiginosum TaxID=110542 RepID=A0ACC0CTS1_9PEZI|nr:putative cytochrome P450 oxidoreductase OrdA-like protein [Hypoxylon rubiginosum]
MDISSLIICAGVGLVVFYITSRAWGLSKDAGHLPLPPGPKGLPLIGNLNDLPGPGVFEAEHWLKHKELYGPISSITVMGQTMVIVNDARIALELLEKRSVIYSSRPRQIFAGEIIGWGNALANSLYNDRFRTYRKNISRIIGSKVTAAQFDKLQEAEVGHFLLHILNSPERLLDHIRKEAGAVITKIVYGYTAESHRDDPFIDLAGRAMDHFSEACVPGAFMVDIFPFLNWLPEWFPGAGFKRIGRQWRAELIEMAERPRNFVKHQMAQGKDQDSFLGQLIERGDTDPEQQYTNKFSAFSLYAGGADTTVSSMMCFFLAMTLYPEAQRRAQEEIDSVVGQDRLPTAADRDNLPYVEAVVKEVLRWHPVAPQAIPHTASKDDIYEGYLIPEGAMVIGNVWHFTHDPEVYHDPMEFKPERYLEQDGHKPELDPRTFVFGFGRRICPGRILADNSLYISIVQSLAVFNISKHVENGQEVEPFVHFEPGLISHPEPYKNLIKPRSPHHEKLIRSIEDRYPWEESDSKVLESVY